ncbi:MAG TPA: ATP-binding protein [Vicinamibacterales bacterium]|nr:ATP-binding protein [Vicinamibacterales bacterium]
MNGASSDLTVYEVAPTAAPYEPAFLRRVRLRARRLVLWLQHVWTSAPGAFGLSISYDEVDRLLRDGAELARHELAFYENDPAARALAGLIDDADAAAAADPIRERLRRDLGLEDVELDLLALTVAVEADPWLRRVFGYIHDDATSALPTPWLARQLFQWPSGTRIGPACGLIRWKLARPVEPQANPWSVTASWMSDPFVASFLIDGTALDPSLGSAVRLVPPRARFDAAECLYPSELATIVAFVRALDDEVTEVGRGRSIEIVLAGPQGAGKRTLAAQLCTTLQRPLLVADAASWSNTAIDPAAGRDAVLRVVRTARLLGAGVYWQDFGGTAAAARDLPAPALSLFGATGAATPSLDPAAARRMVRLPPLTQAMRAELWGRLSGHAVPPPVLDWPLLPSDIVRAAQVAPAGLDAVTDACRATARLDSISLASPLPRPYVWADLVLSASVRRHIDELEMQARWRWPVYEGWGFARLCPMGRGITALFAGASGTGKTMAAQVLARSLGMEIYRVDLAAVMSKYIGETEKNLAQVFDACERANVLLFFDEADALFGRRMQIKDAHDRFANIEIDYLLQRMEQFDGIAVLATNRKNEIDSAFLRRVRFIVDFLMPGVPERRELWTRALPSHAPDGEALLDAIDWDFLAQRLTLSGADIKSAAIGAAFLARGEGVRIGTSHVMRAARRELAKHGIVVRAGEMEA